MEMLIVVAIIAVLVAIAIPVFMSQLENSRESTDAANLRSAYAEVMACALTDAPDGNNQGVTVGSADGGKTYTKFVAASQTDGTKWNNTQLVGSRIGTVEIKDSGTGVVAPQAATSNGDSGWNVTYNSANNTTTITTTTKTDNGGN